MMGPSGSGKSTFLHILGVIASILPARRAARLDRLAALHYE